MVIKLNSENPKATIIIGDSQEGFYINLNKCFYRTEAGCKKGGFYATSQGITN
jgi:hypothetical protein